MAWPAAPYRNHPGGALSQGPLIMRGMKEAEMAPIAGFIDRVLTRLGDAATEAAVRTEVQELTSRFPLYPERLRP